MLVEAWSNLVGNCSCTGANHAMCHGLSHPNLQSEDERQSVADGRRRRRRTDRVCTKMQLNTKLQTSQNS